jgi:hypothetical protein
MIDWILLPQEAAQRPPNAQLLFDKVGITLQSIADPTPAERLSLLAERNAFFWMMLAITVKYMARQDAVKVQGLLDMLHHLLRDVEHLVAGHAWQYHRGSLMDLQITYDGQLMTCQKLIQRMSILRPQIIDLGVDLHPVPTETIERLFDLH